MPEARTKSKRRRGNFLLMIVSAVIAVILWAILSITNFSEAEVVLRDVPIDFSLEGSYASLASLDIISAEIDSVDISFDGLRYFLSDYSADDIHITLDLNNVRASGSYDIPLIVTSSRDDIKNIQIAPESVHIDFDKLATKILSAEDGTLTVDLSNISASEGHTIDPTELNIAPAQITVSGPQDYIDQVTSGVLSFESGYTLSESQNLTATDITLYSDSAVFDNPRVSVDTREFIVYVPVYITKELKLEVGLMSYSDQIDLSLINYTLSTESITVRSQNPNLQNIDSINLGYIDIRDITPGFAKTIQIPQNSNYTNISGIEEVQVSFELEGYATSTFTLRNSQINLLNKPAGFDVTVETDRIRITAIGPADILEALDSNSFVAEIDLADYDAAATTRFLTAYVTAPGYPSVWVSGTMQVLASYEPIATDDDTE